MPDIKRTVKIVTEQHILDKPSGVEGFPMRQWSISLYLVHETTGEDIPATLFDRATYKLHPSFEKRAVQHFKKPPFRIQEEGWGEFDLQIVLQAGHKGGEHTLEHDLNFQSERYEAKHTVTFKNPRPELVSLLAESGPTGVEENGVRAGKKGEAPKRKPKKGQNIDMDKLADGLRKIEEDDLLHVVQIISDHRTPETYIKNDAENGEFHVDLYTLSDECIKLLWEYTASKVEL